MLDNVSSYVVERRNDRYTLPAGVLDKSPRLMRRLLRHCGRVVSAAKTAFEWVTRKKRVTSGGSLKTRRAYVELAAGETAPRRMRIARHMVA